MENSEVLRDWSETEPGSIELLAATRSGVYFPIATFKAAALMEKGFDNQFMLRFIGQMPQSYVGPSACRASTPQVASPVQDLNCATGGSPGRTETTDAVNVTIFFAIGQSKVVGREGMGPGQD